MSTSLTIPTATSQRMIPVRVLDENRQLINEQRALTGKSKISYTHLIGWALIRAVDEFRQLNDAYTEQKGEPFRVVRKSVNFGLAVDVKGKDGNSTLMVPNIKGANGLSFTGYLESVRRCRRARPTGKLMPNDFPGTTISLTNPGTVGTFGSVPQADGRSGRDYRDGRDGLPGRIQPGIARDAGIARASPRS